MSLHDILQSKYSNVLLAEVLGVHSAQVAKLKNREKIRADARHKLAHHLVVSDDAILARLEELKLAHAAERKPRHAPYQPDHLPAGVVANPVVIDETLDNFYLSAAVDSHRVVVVILHHDENLVAWFNRRIYHRDFQHFGEFNPSDIPASELPALIKAMMHGRGKAAVFVFPRTQALPENDLEMAIFLSAILTAHLHHHQQIQLYLQLPPSLTPPKPQREAVHTLTQTLRQAKLDHLYVHAIQSADALGLQAANLLLNADMRLPHATREKLPIQVIHYRAFADLPAIKFFHTQYHQP